jgi:hypothetical protein
MNVLPVTGGSVTELSATGAWVNESLSVIRRHIGMGLFGYHPHLQQHAGVVQHRLF